MAYSDYEKSNTDGRPVDLYEFEWNGLSWYFTSADQDLTVPVTVDGSVISRDYTAATLSRGAWSQSKNDQNILEISCAADNAVAALFRNNKPSGKVWVTVKEYHLNDPDHETAIQWIGSVTNVVRDDSVSATMSCRSISGTFDRNGLRLLWGRTCPHILYGIGCRVDKTLHEYPREIATVNGSNFTCVAHSEAEEGSFAGGLIEWTNDDGGTERKAIESQDRNDFRIIGSTAGIEVGMSVTLHPGCDRSTSVCKLFDNLPNYGGCPHMPGKSPFDGTPVF